MINRLKLIKINNQMTFLLHESFVFLILLIYARVLHASAKCETQLGQLIVCFAFFYFFSWLWDGEQVEIVHRDCVIGNCDLRFLLLEGHLLMSKLMLIFRV